MSGISHFFMTASVMWVQWSVSLELPLFAEFALEVLLLGWEWNLSLFIEIIEFFCFLNILFRKIVFASQYFVKSQLHMILFLLCVEYIIVLLQIFFFQLLDNPLQKIRINTIQDLTGNFSKSDILWEDTSLVIDKLFMIIDFVHGEKRYLFS